MRTLIPLLAVALLALTAPAAARAGDLVVTEIAANPALPEPGAEFVVVDNVGRAPVLLDGVRLTDAARAARGVVGAGTSLDPGQRIALQPAAGASAYACSPLPHRALLTAWAGLNNAGDTVVLEAADGTEIDRVAYPRDAFAGDGPSRRLDAAFRTPAANDDFARWALGAGAATPCALPPPRPGSVRLASSTVAVREGAPAAAIVVARSGGTNGRVTVPWSTLDGSATAGADYARSGGTVVLAAAQERATIVVPLLGDDRDEPDETFTVTLGAPGGGAQLGAPARATVVVGDDDVPPAPAPSPTPPAAPGVAPGPAALLPPAGAPSAPARSPLAPAHAALAVAPWQRVLRRGGVAVSVGCDRDCTVAAGGRIALGRGRFVQLVGVRRELRAHMPALVLLRVPRRSVRPLRRALHRRGSLRATVTASPAGGIAAERGVDAR